MSAPSGIKVPTSLATAFHSALNEASDVRALVFVIEGGEWSLWELESGVEERESPSTMLRVYLTDFPRIVQSPDDCENKGVVQGRHRAPRTRLAKPEVTGQLRVSAGQQRGREV